MLNPAHLRFSDSQELNLGKAWSMKISDIALFLTVLCAPAAGFAGQAGQAQNAAPQTAAPAKAVPVSSLLQPSLDALQQTLGSVRLEKWKGGSVRTEAAANIASIQKDLQGKLPELTAGADAAPGVMSKVLPVVRNLDALYDVLLRVVDGAQIAAPVEQVDQLTQAMAGVEKARLALSDRLEEMAAGTEKQIVVLQASVKPQPAPVCPVVAPAPAAQPAPKKRVAKKKPATPPQTATPQPQGAAKPNP
jgi:hypothetical protein